MTTAAPRFSTASTAGFPTFRENRFLQAVCIATAVMVALNSIHPDSVFDFCLENGAVLILLAALVPTYRKLPLSDLSYALIFVYLSLHEWGAHYQYYDVPLGEWMKSWLHTDRNMYDRVVHTSFGLLMSYPLQEILMRRIGVRSGWRYILPVEAILSFSAIYEMMEAGAAMVLSPDRGEEFVGMQGDIWDSQKDMFVAGVGAVAAMLLLAAARYWWARRAARELEATLSAK